MTAQPVLAALAVLIHEDRTLLVRRRNKPDAGLWGFPGGKVEWGETVSEAAVRELREETTVAAEPLAQLRNLDIVHRDASGVVQHHFLLVAVLCRYLGGTPRPGDDAEEAAWLPVAEILARDHPMSANVDAVLRLALDHRLDHRAD